MFNKWVFKKKTCIGICYNIRRSEDHLQGWNGFCLFTVWDPWDEHRLSGSMGSTLTWWTTSQAPINNVYTQKNKHQSKEDRQQVLPTPELQEHLTVQTMHNLCSCESLGFSVSGAPFNLAYPAAENSKQVRLLLIVKYARDDKLMSWWEV